MSPMRNRHCRGRERRSPSGAARGRTDASDSPCFQSESVFVRASHFHFHLPHPLRRSLEVPPPPTPPLPLPTPSSAGAVLAAWKRRFHARTGAATPAVLRGASEPADRRFRPIRDSETAFSIPRRILRESISSVSWNGHHLPFVWSTNGLPESTDKRLDFQQIRQLISTLYPLPNRHKKDSDSESFCEFTVPQLGFPIV